MISALLHEHPGNRRAHQVSQGCGNDRTEAHLGKILSSGRRNPAQAANKERNRRQIGEAAQREADDDDALGDN